MIITLYIKSQIIRNVNTDETMRFINGAEAIIVGSNVSLVLKSGSTVSITGGTHNNCSLGTTGIIVE